MAKRYQIKIESVLGGHSPTTHFAAANQYKASYGIDPGSPINDTINATYGTKPSGLLRPTISSTLTGTLNNTPFWMDGVRGTTTIFVYDRGGSAYTFSPSGSTFTGLSDAGTLSNSSGNGMAYYDNYLYFAKDTDITRYGPLDGTPGFVDNYWTGTLGKTALTDTYYPLHNAGGSYSNLPNHFLHRHSDGRLYIADAVDNQGTLHFIQTTKTTVEGDTNNGSTYDYINVGYGLMITCMETYGEFLVMALFERDGTGNQTGRGKSTRAKVAFWDTTSQNINSITWVEFPDGLITAMKNVNGTLYVFSAPAERAFGYRVSRYVGGYSFEEVWSSEDGVSPFPGAVDGTSNRLVFGSRQAVPDTRGVAFSLGLSTNNLSNQGIFCPFAVNTSNDVSVTALLLNGGGATPSKSFDYPFLAYGNYSGNYGIDGYYSGSGSSESKWWSQLFRIGQPFKIISIRIPLAQILTSNMNVVPKIYIDSGSGSETLRAITSANYGTNTQTIVIRPENLTADNDFWLELYWLGSVECTIALPITIEYELLDVDQAYV